MLIQVWTRCDYIGCDRMQDMLVELDAAVHKSTQELPAGWSHVRQKITDKAWSLHCQSGVRCPEHASVGNLACEHGGIPPGTRPI